MYNNAGYLYLYIGYWGYCTLLCTNCIIMMINIYSEDNINNVKKVTVDRIRFMLDDYGIFLDIFNCIGSMLVVDYQLFSRLHYSHLHPYPRPYVTNFLILLFKPQAMSSSRCSPRAISQSTISGALPVAILTLLIKHSSLTCAPNRRELTFFDSILDYSSNLQFLYS